MKKILLLSVALLFIASTTFAQQANDIQGFWYLQADSKGRIPVGYMFSKNNKFYLYAIGFSNSKDINYDVNNPEPKLRERSTKGLMILSDLVFDKDENEWVEGKIYNPEKGKLYYAKLKLSSDKKTITLRASADGFGLFGKNLTWTRAPQNQYQPLPENLIHNP